MPVSHNDLPASFEERKEKEMIVSHEIVYDRDVLVPIGSIIHCLYENGTEVSVPFSYVEGMENMDTFSIPELKRIIRWLKSQPFNNPRKVRPSAIAEGQEEYEISLGLRQPVLD